MGKSTKQLKRVEALFVPNRRGSIEFAGVVEASRDDDCDIHGRRGSLTSSTKRNSISINNLNATKRDSIQSNGNPIKRDSIGSTSTSTAKRDSVDSPFKNSYLSNYTVLNRQESVDRELAVNDYAVPRRRSSAGKSADANNR